MSIFAFLSRKRKGDMVAVAQSVRASDCGSEGRGFESHRPPKREAPQRCFSLLGGVAALPIYPSF